MARPDLTTTRVLRGLFWGMVASGLGLLAVSAANLVWVALDLPTRVDWQLAIYGAFTLGAILSTVGAAVQTAAFFRGAHDQPARGYDVWTWAGIGNAVFFVTRGVRLVIDFASWYRLPILPPWILAHRADLFEVARHAAHAANVIEFPLATLAILGEARARGVLPRQWHISTMGLLVAWDVALTLLGFFGIGPAAAQHLPIAWHAVFVAESIAYLALWIPVVAACVAHARREPR